MPYTKHIKQTNPMNLKALALATIATLTPAVANANTLQQAVSNEPQIFMHGCTKEFRKNLGYTATVTLRRAGMSPENLGVETCQVMMAAIMSGDTMSTAIQLGEDYYMESLQQHFSHSYDRPMKISDLHTLIR